MEKDKIDKMAFKFTWARLHDNRCEYGDKRDRKLIMFDSYDIEDAYISGVEDAIRILKSELTIKKK